MTNSTVERFQLLDASQLDYPNKCSVCGSFTSNNGKKFITFGCWIEFYGTVYFCTDCFTGATNLLLDVTPTKAYVEACRQIDELKAVVGTLISENRYLRDAVDNLRTFDRSHPDNYSGPSIRDSIPEPESESAEPVREVSPDITTGESRPVEQINERRPADVPNDDSNSPGIGLSVFNI